MGLKSITVVRGRLATLSAISALRGARDNLRFVVWQPYALSLGLDMKSIGGLESLMDFTKLLTEPSFGSISDVMGRKKLMVFREALALLAGLMFLFARSWHLLFLGMMLVGLSMALVSVWNTVVAESADPSRLGYVYSLVGTSYMGAGLIGTLGAGYMADAFGYSWVYLVATGFGVLSLLFVHLRLPETRGGDGKKLNWTRTAAAFLKAFNPPRHLKGFYIAMALDLFAFGIGFRLLTGMLNKAYGYTPTMISLGMTAMTAAMALGQVPFGRLADNFGYAKFMALSQLTAGLMLGLIIYSKSFEFVFAGYVIIGIANSLWMPAEQAWIAANVDPSERAQSLGGFATFRGLAVVPAPIIGGILFDAYGFDAPIALNLVLALLDGILIVLLVKDKPKT